jgi:GTP-binding protein
MKELQADLEETLAQVRGVPMVPISGLTGHGLDRLLERVLALRNLEQARPDGSFEPLAFRNDGKASAAGRFRSPHQAEIPDPIEDAAADLFLSCSRPEALPDAYKRYLVNGLREDFGLAGVPVRLMLRRDVNPYEGRKRES